MRGKVRGVRRVRSRKGKEDMGKTWLGGHSTMGGHSRRTQQEDIGTEQQREVTTGRDGHMCLPMVETQGRWD
jgi:hypothetical protein